MKKRSLKQRFKVGRHAIAKVEGIFDREVKVLSIHKDVVYAKVVSQPYRKDEDVPQFGETLELEANQICTFNEHLRGFLAEVVSTPIQRITNDEE